MLARDLAARVRPLMEALADSNLAGIGPKGQKLQNPVKKLVKHPKEVWKGCRHLQ